MGRREREPMTKQTVTRFAGGTRAAWWSWLVLALLAPAVGGCGEDAPPSSTGQDPASKEFAFRPHVADGPTPSPGGPTVYAGQGKMTILVHAGGVKHEGDVSMVVELKEDGSVTGTLRSKRIDLMSGNLRGPERAHTIFGTHANGEAVLGTIDERGSRNPGWLKATYNRIIFKVSGSKTQTEIGITVTESVEARLRPR